MGLALSLRLWSRISKKQPKQKQQNPFMIWVKGTVLTMTLTLAFGQIATHIRGQIPSSSPDELTFYYIANYALNILQIISINLLIIPLLQLHFHLQVQLIVILVSGFKFSCFVRSDFLSLDGIIIVHNHPWDYLWRGRMENFLRSYNDDC